MLRNRITGGPTSQMLANGETSREAMVLSVTESGSGERNNRTVRSTQLQRRTFSSLASKLPAPSTIACCILLRDTNIPQMLRNEHPHHVPHQPLPITLTRTHTRLQYNRLTAMMSRRLTHIVLLDPHPLLLHLDSFILKARADE